MLVEAAVFLPPFSQTFARALAFAAAHPEQSRVTVAPGAYSVEIHGSHPELFPDFGALLARMGLVMAVAVMLWAAAVARRLHDRGKTASWGLMPLPFFTFSMVGMPKVMAAMGGQTIPPLFYALFLSNLLYLATGLWLVFMLGGSSASGPNRWGEAPPQPVRRPPPPLGPRRTS